MGVVRPRPASLLHRPIADSPVVLRVVLCIVHGATLSVAAYMVSRLAAGLVGAAAFVLVFCFGALTAGCAIAIAADPWLGRPKRPAAVRRRTRDGAPGVVCHCCGRPMVPLRSAWVCEVCDR
jgi:hypothetical protein